MKEKKGGKRESVLMKLTEGWSEVTVDWMGKMDVGKYVEAIEQMGKHTTLVR